MCLYKRQDTSGLVFPAPQMVNAGRLKQENCVGMHNTELVTTGHTQVVVETHKTVILSWTHGSHGSNIEADLQS